MFADVNNTISKWCLDSTLQAFNNEYTNINLMFEEKCNTLLSNKNLVCAFLN